MRNENVCVYGKASLRENFGDTEHFEDTGLVHIVIEGMNNGEKN